jgi:cytochrome c biogenesis factor
MTLVGELCLWVALLIAAWSAAVSILGAATNRAPLVMSGARGIRALAVLLLIALAGLFEALLSREFSLRHVAHYSSADLLPAYTVAAVWVGGAGALLFCAAAVAIAAAALQGALRRTAAHAAPLASGFLAIVLCFLLAILVFRAGPFARLEWVPPDGRGLHPLLQHPLILVHPPLVWIGYAMSAVPCALVGGAVVRGKLEAAEVRIFRLWSHALWIMLTAAILTGLWWSYAALGWSGRWPLHPIENGSVMPWIAATVFLVATRGRWDRRWVLTLPIAAFMSAILAALATNAGLFGGGPAFARAPGSIWILVLVCLALLVAADLIRTRVSYAAGTSRRRGRVSELIVAAGALLVVAGFLSVAVRREYDLLLRAGESAQLAGRTGEWRLVSEGISRYNIFNRHVLGVTLATYRGDDMLRVVSAERHDAVSRRGEVLFQHASRAAVVRTLSEDAYLVLAGVPERETADLRVTLTPLVSLIWIGGTMLLLGGAFALWPRGPEQP